MLKKVQLKIIHRFPKAIAAGADRIELTDNLAVGGTTESKGVMAESTKYVHEHGRSPHH